MGSGFRYLREIDRYHPVLQENLGWVGMQN